MLSRLARAQAEVTRQLDAFDFSQAALALYDFVYGELCDWYLELVKPRLRASEPELIATLLHVLTETISLAHPIIPFETEEIWSLIPGSEGLLAQRVVPDAERRRATNGARAPRPRPRSSARSPRSRRCDAGATAPRSRPEPCSRRGWRRPDTSRPPSTSPGWRACRSTATRRTRRRRRSRPCRSRAASSRSSAARGSIATPRSPSCAPGSPRSTPSSRRARAKLANQGFVAKAPPHVVQGERDKLEQLTGERERLAAELRALGEDAEG